MTHPNDQWAFEVFAAAHPHEAHESDPERFWAWFHRVRPIETRESMVKFLEETDDRKTV